LPGHTADENGHSVDLHAESENHHCRSREVTIFEHQQIHYRLAAGQFPDGELAKAHLFVALH
jgi:hypothetical protein